MGWLDRLRGSASSAPSAETRAITPTAFFEALGMDAAAMPAVTLDRALQVPAVVAWLTFLPNTLAALPLQLFKSSDVGAEKQSGGLAIVLGEAPNPETTSYELRRQMWLHYFTEGRGLVWIERGGNGQAVALWNMDPRRTTVKREGGRKVYHYDGQRAPYPAADVIDLVWMPKPDGLGHYGPIQRGARAINDMIAMQEYSSRLFSKGGVPPLALKGKLPTTGADAMKRALGQIKEAIETAAEANLGIAQIPQGFELEKIGVDPQAGQMVEAKRFGIEEIARLAGLPPVFLQDLTHGTFSNTEQQDLHLVKHRVVQLAVALEQALDLKLFGPKRNQRYVKHNVDGLLRGDFKSRMEGLARGVQGGIYKPNEARALENLPKDDDPASDQLHMQGATVPIGGQDSGASNDGN